jgi:hypothetical protein
MAVFAHHELTRLTRKLCILRVPSQTLGARRDGASFIAGGRAGLTITPGYDRTPVWTRMAIACSKRFWRSRPARATADSSRPRRAEVYLAAPWSRAAAGNLCGSWSSSQSRAAWSSPRFWQAFPSGSHRNRGLPCSASFQSVPPSSRLLYRFCFTEIAGAAGKRRPAAYGGQNRTCSRWKTALR